MRGRTYGSVHVAPDGQHWILAEVEPHVSIRLKQIFPAIPKTATPPYKLRLTSEISTDLEWFTQRYPMRLDDFARDVMTGGRLRFGSDMAERERILRPDYTPPVRPGFRPGKSLRTYQAQAVEILAARGSLLCGDEVGLGKTIVAAGAMLIPGALPAAVVVEPHVQAQWAEKIAEFTELRVHQIRDTRGRRLPAADVYLWRYSNLAGWVDIIGNMEFGLAAWDEIQRLRRGTYHSGKPVQMGAASMVLSEHSAHRLGLTATPIYNYGVEIFNIMQFLDESVLGSKEDFIREWTSGGGSITDPKALGTYLREQHAFLRRTRKDVGRELPQVNRIVENIDYDQEAVDSVEALARQLAIRATTGEFTERGQAARELDVLVRQATGIAKARHVARFVRILIEAGERVMLAGWHRRVYEIWLEEFKDLQPALYTGSETAARKERVKQAALRGEVNPLILSLRSGAGLDELQEQFEIVVFGELDWSPGIHHQVIGRADRDRIGGPRQVTAIFLVTDEGSDPPMMDVLGLKASEAAGIVDPSLGVQQTHSDTSAIQRLVQRYLERR